MSEIQNQQTDAQRLTRSRNRKLLLLMLIIGGWMLAGALWLSVFHSSRTNVTGIPATSGAERPPVLYSSLYEDGSFEAKCYETLATDLDNGICPTSWNAVTWGLLPARDSHGKSEDDEDEALSTSEILSRVSKFAMLDSPQYASYLQGNMSFSVVGNRYYPEACANISHNEIMARYSNIQALVTTYCMNLRTMAEGSDAKYACVAYRFVCETVSYSNTSTVNDVEAALETHETGHLGLALTMKMLLDAQGIPNYVAYGTWVDTGLPYTWNVVWVEDSWKVFDVPNGCQTVVAKSAKADDDLESFRWTLDSNVASIPMLLPGCMVTPEEYSAKLKMNDACSELQLRYEALVSSNKTSSQVDGEDVAIDITDGMIDPLARLRYSNLLDSVDHRFYDAVAEDLVSGRVINDDNPETWFISPVVIENDEECTRLTEIASCVMYDNPVLSVTNGGGGWALKYWSKKSEYGDISRYFISSPISNSDGNVDLKMQATRNSATTICEQAEEESQGNLRKFVLAAYRDISANCSYSDDVDDTVHHNDAYGALVENESKCYGVSCGMKMVLDLKGIPNFVAFGTYNGEGHAWNMVNLDGEWFACDLTAGSLMTEDTYAPGTINRQVLLSEVNELDTFYTKCLVPADDFYASSQGIVPSDLSMRLQESYDKK